MMTHTKALLALTLLLVGVLPARAALELNDGDSIVVVGNTFAERLALSGYFDAMVHAANPDKKIVIRSVPNSADEVDDMPREHSVPDAAFYLKRHGADVVVMCFGMSESFDGMAGIDKFKNDLASQVDVHLNAKYNGASSPKIVLVSPIAHEDLGGIWPTGAAVVERNGVLKAYSEAVAEVAKAKGAIFIDLFTSTVKPAGTQLTNNGIAPNELGCFVYAGMMAKQLGWWDGTPAKEAGNAAELRQVAYDKHYHFRHRYRATNTEYVWGRRHKPFGIKNFPEELDQLDKMVAAREAAMWSMKKPTVAQLFAKAPSGKAIWETTPTDYNYPEDKWTPTPIEIPDITRAVGDPNAIKAPEEYLKTFQVAQGYQVNLFASEREFSELANPLAMTFDAKGRLWVLCAPTYPHLLPGAVPDCKLIILEDSDKDGKADKRTVFARHMNIPTGFVIDANGVAYVGQAPDLWKLTDTDGDDVADRKEIVYSGFGMPDSHHTISAFVWDPHGGILMLEGVFTKTNVETPYGTQRTRDAAIWRYDPRTNKLIAIGHTGHPNPWGQTFDQYGQSILMDTSGAAQYNFSSLISPYVGFEKPPKGPAVVQRGRPTAGCEIIYSRHFPDDVQGTYVHSQCIGFLGTNWDRLLSDGATNSGYTSQSMPEPILSSQEGNYRPVCSELGPDGALYIADWVNPLIGHMQFNLRDPRRDHTHGRIYRVTHKERPLVQTPDLTKLDMAGLFEQLKVTEQNTRDRARRLLQSMDAAKVSKAASDWLMAQNPREADYDRWALEALWVQQGAGKMDMKVVDEAMRAREPLVRAGAIRVLRIALQFGDMAPADAQPFIAQAVNDRDMRVRLEAVMGCAFLDSPQAVDLANQVTNQPMDTAIRNAHKQTLKYLEAHGHKDGQEKISSYILMPVDELVAKAEKDMNPDIARAVLGRPAIALELRRKALDTLATTPAERGKALIQTTKITLFEPSELAEAITPLLLELPKEGVLAIDDALSQLLDSPDPAMRSAALAVKVRSGSPLPGLAARDPVALIDAIAALPADQAPASLASDLVGLVETGQLDPALAFEQAVRLSSDFNSLFKRLASLIDLAQATDYTQWNRVHQIGMAALATMHAVPDADWPQGFDSYRIERADPEIYAKGEAIFHDHNSNGCATCHGINGQGMENMPPLAGSPWILGDAKRPAAIVKHGLNGELPGLINPATGSFFNTQMEPQSQYNDAQVAAVLTYIRQSWGNFAPPVSPQQVASARGPKEGDKWVPRELLAQYPFERDHLMGTLPAPETKIVDWKAPGAGVIYMLVLVCVLMGLILVVTWIGSQPVDAVGPHGTPAIA